VNVPFYTHVDVFRNCLVKKFLEVSTMYPKEKFNLGGGYFCKTRQVGMGAIFGDQKRESN
jgi:hypothetical protein